MSIANSPIGIFDSGIGGTSIWKEIKRVLPNEKTIYLSDSRNAPYGPKGKDKIIELAIKNTDLLLSRGCKLIVVACNTATTNAISYLRENYEVPFIGIEPAIKPASLRTKSGIIGILATKGTLNSELFTKTSSSLERKIKIIEQVGTGLVEFIENGKINTQEMDYLLKSYIHPLLAQNADCLVLGCTHYPYLIPQIRKIVGPDFQIIDSGEAVARQTKNILNQYHLEHPSQETGTHQFFINIEKKVLEQFIPPSDITSIKELDF